MSGVAAISASAAIYIITSGENAVIDVHSLRMWLRSGYNLNWLTKLIENCKNTKNISWEKCTFFPRSLCVLCSWLCKYFLIIVLYMNRSTHICIFWGFFQCRSWFRTILKIWIFQKVVFFVFENFYLCSPWSSCSRHHFFGNYIKLSFFWRMARCSSSIMKWNAF